MPSEAEELVLVSGTYTPAERKKEVIPFHPEISAGEYLRGIETDIIARIEHLSKGGKLEDAVKLRANETLWKKIRPDKGIARDPDLEESPYEAILRRLERRGDE